LKSKDKFSQLIKTFICIIFLNKHSIQTLGGLEESSVNFTSQTIERDQLENISKEDLENIMKFDFTFQYQETEEKKKRKCVTEYPTGKLEIAFANKRIENKK